MSINVLNTFKKKLHLVKFPLHESLHFSSTAILKNRSFISYKSEICYALTYKNNHLYQKYYEIKNLCMIYKGSTILIKFFLVKLKNKNNLKQM